MDKNGRVRLFYQIMKEVFDKKTVTLLIANLESIGFFDAPASTKYHGNYPGGLFDHSFAVTKTLLSLPSLNGWNSNGSVLRVLT